MRDDTGRGINRRGLIVKGLVAGGAATLLSGARQGAGRRAPASAARVHGDAFAMSFWSTAPTPTGRPGLR